MKKVVAGDKLRRIPADTWNNFIDAAEDYKSRQRNQSQDAASGMPGDIVKIKNISGADCTRFQILGIFDFLVQPYENLPEFKNQFSFQGCTPDDATYFQKTGLVAIVQEPIKNGFIGKAKVSGISPVQVSFTDDAHLYADVILNDRTKLASGSSGPFTIIGRDWYQSAPCTVWSVVRWGASPGATQLYRAKITSIGTSGSTFTAQKVNSAGTADGVNQTVYVLPSKGSVTFASQFPVLAVNTFILYTIDQNNEKFLVTVLPVLPVLTCT